MNLKERQAIRERAEKDHAVSLYSSVLPREVLNLLDELEKAIELLEKTQHGFEGASPLGKWIKAFLDKHRSKA